MVQATGVMRRPSRLATIHVATCGDRPAGPTNPKETVVVIFGDAHQSALCLDER
jgi:hypothetical protein